MSRNIARVQAMLVTLACLGGTLSAATAGKLSVKLIIPVTKSLVTVVDVQGVSGDIVLTNDKDLGSVPNPAYQKDLCASKVTLDGTKNTFMLNLIPKKSSGKADGTIVLSFSKNGTKDSYTFHISASNNQATVDRFPSFTPDAGSPIQKIALGGRAKGLTDQITVTPN